MKYYYATTEDGLERIIHFVKRLNPPEGMSCEDVKKEFTSILLEEQYTLSPRPRGTKLKRCNRSVKNEVENEQNYS